MGSAFEAAVLFFTVQHLEEQAQNLVEIKELEMSVEEAEQFQQGCEGFLYPLHLSW